MSTTGSRLLGRIGRSYVLFVALGVIVGAVAAPVAYDATTQTDGTVAVVPLEGTIDGQSSAAVAAMLTEARQNPSIDAVVIVTNSGGGGAAASEELYLQAKRTAATKPLVAAVDSSAASGAYYTIAPADAIYVKPASVVGSVGVLATLPQDLEPNDVVGTTGPNKLSGADEREFLYILESLHRAFIGAVLEQRGDALTMSRAELEQARVYSGGQAVENGLADHVGGREAAIRDAARRANLDTYSVRVLRPDNTTARFVSQANYLASDAPTRERVSAEYLLGNGTGGPVFLMIAPMYLDGGAVAAVEARAVTPPNETVADARTANGTATNGTTTGTDGPPASVGSGGLEVRDGAR
ncbi:S49 family peptidase [Halobaculum limi]|uniref:S49 family peptidase n=1 Tax=Halobaculum limi TaxID=3031916 RepID=UPI0024074514|nr:S49 family peptidase [Halobaculum sp. YSMS11]